MDVLLGPQSKDQSQKGGGKGWAATEKSKSMGEKLVRAEETRMAKARGA